MLLHWYLPVRGVRSSIATQTRIGIAVMLAPTPPLLLGIRPERSVWRQQDPVKSAKAGAIDRALATPKSVHGAPLTYHMLHNLLTARECTCTKGLHGDSKILYSRMRQG